MASWLAVLLTPEFLLVRNLKGLKVGSPCYLSGDDGLKAGYCGVHKCDGLLAGHEKLTYTAGDYKSASG